MRIARVLFLAVLSPWVAEYLVFGTVDRLGLTVFLAPMYGSIAVPIAVTEGLAGRRWRTRPWLHRPGLIVAALLYVGGALLIRFDVDDGFVPSATQYAVALGLLVLFLGGALMLGRRRPPLGARKLAPWWIGLASFVVAAGWILMPESWYGVAGEVAMLTIGSAGLLWAARHIHWTPVHTVAAAAGPLIAYALTAYVYPVADYPGDQGNPATEHLSEALFTILAVALVAGATWRSRTQLAAEPA